MTSPTTSSSRSAATTATTPTGTIATVVDIVRAHRDEDRPMLTFEGRTATFAEVDRRSSQVAHALRAEGVGRGDRVAYLGRNRPEYFDVLFGAAKVGAVCVAVNWRLAPIEIAHVLQDATASVLVVDDASAHVVEQIEGALPHLVVVSLDEHDRWPDLASWCGDQPTDDPGIETGADSVALQLYTSGTTGLPKGALLTNRNLFAMASTAGPEWGFHRDMVTLGVSPLFHVAGSGWILMVMAEGGHSVLHRDVDADAILRDIVQHRVTHALLVPAILQQLLNAEGAGEADVSSVETIVYGASPIAEPVLVRLLETFACDFVQGYGLTETCGAVTVLPAADHDPARPELLRSCGRALPGVQLRIVDTDTGATQPEGEVGEVWIHGGQVMTGYWNKPEETAAAITPDGWFRTGDAGYLRDGRLYLHDRVNDMVVSGGENVYPAEVERVLVGHPAVAEVSVIGVPHDRWGETVKAVVVPAGGRGGPDDEAALIAHARDHLAHYKCPTSVDFVEELPRNPSGKVLKRELRDPYWVGRERRIG